MNKQPVQTEVEYEDPESIAYIMEQEEWVATYGSVPVSKFKFEFGSLNDLIAD